MRTYFRQAICTSVAALATISMSGVYNAAVAQAVFVEEPAARTVVREPLALTPAQRTTIYRTIVPRGRGKQPIVRERVVTETMGSAPVRERVVVEPPLGERVIAAPTEVEYVVGGRVPASARLAAFPDRIVREVPATRGYRYMVVNDRLLLVDPATSTVVEEIVRD
jgi:hypothetical protein